MVIELSGEQFCLKSQVWLGTKIARRSSIPALLHQYFNDQLTGLLESGNKKAFKSYFVLETEMMHYRRYRAKMVRFKTAMMGFKVCENDSFTRPPSMFYKYRRKNSMIEYIQACVSSSVKRPFTNCFLPWFTGALRFVWVRLVYIILDYDYQLYGPRHCSPYTVYLDFSGDYPLC